MPDLVIHSEEYSEGYRVTNTARGLIIEPVGSDQRPLELPKEQLAKYGLRYEYDHYIPIGESDEPQAVVDRILGSLTRAIEVLQVQKDTAAYRWDIENLKRAWTVLGGLDEKGVQRIFDEEG